MDRPALDVAHVLPHHHLERRDRDRGQRRHFPAARRPALVPAAHDHLGTSPSAPVCVCKCRSSVTDGGIRCRAFGVRSVVLGVRDADTNVRQGRIPGTDRWKPIDDNPEAEEDASGVLIVRIRENLDFGTSCPRPSVHICMFLLLAFSFLAHVRSKHCTAERCVPADGSHLISVPRGWQIADGLGYDHYGRIMQNVCGAWSCTDMTSTTRRTSRTGTTPTCLSSTLPTSTPLMRRECSGFRTMALMTNRNTDQ